MSNPPEDDLVRIGMIASAVVDELSKRYGVHPSEVMDALSYIREHRAFMARMKHSSYLTVIGTLIAASMLVAWEGVKAYLRKTIE